jgi:hypothetical protein
VGFGFYNRAWQPRAAHAGTFDDAWRAERCPQMPADFDFRYYNGAHPDLQAEGYLQGDEPVELAHLTPEGRVQFNLPGVVPTCILQHKDKEEAVAMHLDTVFMEPDERTFCLVWRGRSPIDDPEDDKIEKATIAVQPKRTGL